MLSSIQLQLGESFLSSAPTMPAIIIINYVFVFGFFLIDWCLGVEGVAGGIKPPLVTEDYLLYRITYY